MQVLLKQNSIQRVTTLLFFSGARLRIKDSVNFGYEKGWGVFLHSRSRLGNICRLVAIKYFKFHRLKQAFISLLKKPRGFKYERKKEIKNPE